MFTPPPSPEPHRLQHNEPAPTRSRGSLHKIDVADDPFLSPHSHRATSSSPERSQSSEDDTPLSPNEDPHTYAAIQKKRTGRRIRWTVFLVPVLLVFVGLSTRYLAHRTILSPVWPEPDWEDLVASARNWKAHKRSPQVSSVAQVTTVGGSKPTGTSLSLAPSASAEPTSTDSHSAQVPSAPPVLPTPFPQAFDSTLSTNFTTVGCETFFTNMTQTAALLKCRPLSLLLKDSAAFIQQSQRNISLLNTIIWGTCNTDVDKGQCLSNMDWFAENIRTQCKRDIAANNPLVQDAVAGLDAYGLMREVGCQINTQTNTYCYVEAAQAHPSDLYLYALPLGLDLPNKTVPSCTSCVQDLMRTFVVDGANLTILRETYPSAATIVNDACGSEFVATMAAPNSALSSGPAWSAASLLMASVMAVLGASLAL
ncbi:hypothetical protein BN946_scf184583.g10 [Trametes cinnabarina]|uniref:DUF7729 domain-containing protein n=1 Tax=Pycnoporus cinnabarinus TaxID=5643 RepID=A0A060SQ48_PYCCI|nr:hypothetical protein BN946_scf184583.g10 [Trametes cinnabarina]